MATTPKFRPLPVAMTKPPPGEMVDGTEDDRPPSVLAQLLDRLDPRTLLVLVCLATFFVSLPLAGLFWTLVFPVAGFFTGLGVGSLVVAILLGIDTDDRSTR